MSDNAIVATVWPAKEASGPTVSVYLRRDRGDRTDCWSGDLRFRLLHPEFCRPPVLAQHTAEASGADRLKLGVLGLLMFLAIFLYPLRKCWPWLSRQGSSRHWLDIHAARPLRAVHHRFSLVVQIPGFAGMAFWFMLAVAISGVVGRYLYAQIPRSLNTAELSLREFRKCRYSCAEVAAPGAATRGSFIPVALAQCGSGAEALPVGALAYMMALDVGRGFGLQG